MAEHPTTEEVFFEGENAPHDLADEPIGEVPKPIPLKLKIAAVVGLLVVLGGLFWFAHSGDAGALWVINPSPERVVVGVAGTKNEIEPTQLADIRVPAAQDVEVIVKRTAKSAENVTLDIKRDSEEVAIIDLGGDAAYVVVDVSAFYNKPGAYGTLPIIYTSKPHNVHYLPYPALRLVRPGRPLPERGSWELQAFTSANSGVLMYKVFRVDPKRLEVRGKLAEIFTKAIEANEAGHYDMMSSYATTSTAAQ